MFTQKFIKIFHSVRDTIGLFSLFQNLSLGNASASPKWHLTIPWATSCQCQCVRKILWKYSKRFKSYRHFSTFFTNRSVSKSSQTVRWQNQMFDYRALYEIQLQVSVDFLRVVQYIKVFGICLLVKAPAFIWYNAHCHKALTVKCMRSFAVIKEQPPRMN